MWRPQSQHGRPILYRLGPDKTSDVAPHRPDFPERTTYEEGMGTLYIRPRSGYKKLPMRHERANLALGAGRDPATARWMALHPKALLFLGHIRSTTL